MGGVRKDGILLTDDVGSGGGTSVDIVSPIGPAVKADSVSVTLATDEDPIDVDIPGVATEAKQDDQIVQLTSIDTKLTSPLTTKITDDGIDIAAVKSHNDGLTQTDKGLVTQSILYTRNNDSTVTPWEGSNQYATFASGNHPWVKALRSSQLSSESTLDALNAQINVDLRERSFEAVAIFLRNSNLQGTLQFLSEPGDANTSLQVYDVGAREWIIGTLVNPTVDKLYIIPCSGLANIFARVTAYTSGSLLAKFSGGPGVGALYAEVSGSTVIIQPDANVTVTGLIDAILEEVVIDIPAGYNSVRATLVATALEAEIFFVDENNNPIYGLVNFGTSGLFNLFEITYGGETNVITVIFSVEGASQVKVIANTLNAGSLNVTLIASLSHIAEHPMTTTEYMGSIGLTQVVSMPTVDVIIEKTDLTPSVPTTVNVGVASAQAVAAAATRKGLILRNLSSARISLGFGNAAVLDSGVTLYPLDIYQMGEYDFDLGAVNAIASAAASPLAIQQYLT